MFSIRARTAFRSLLVVVTAPILVGCRDTCPPRIALASPPPRPQPVIETPARAPESAESQSSFAPSSDAASVENARDAGTTGPTTKEERAMEERFDGAAPLEVLTGKAAYYSDALAGRSTASGEPYDPQRFMAAHRSLPFGTVVRVIRTDRDLSTYVRITDRGPFGDARRIIDLAKIAARRLDMLDEGVVNVRLEVVHRGGDQ